MNGIILCVGKLKEKWQQQGCAEYLKRLSRYGKYEIITVDDVKDPDKPSEALIRQNMEREGQALLRHIRPTDRVICLCIKADSREQLCADPRIVRMMEERMETLQQGLASYERIKRFKLLAEPFSMENGELTNTLKIRRNVLAKNYAAEIDEMYKEEV